MTIKKFSWNEIEKLIDDLVAKIKATSFKPDYLVGITHGGLIPLYFLAKKLAVDKILTVSARSYEKQKQKELEITYLPEIDLKGKNVLLVDEITDTGVSLKGVSEALVRKCKPRELKTVTLVVNKKNCKFYPDFYGTEEREWIVFPWERGEFPEYF